jgi:hypothetical protein
MIVECRAVFCRTKGCYFLLAGCTIVHGRAQKKSPECYVKCNSLRRSNRMLDSRPAWRNLKPLPRRLRRGFDPTAPTNLLSNQHVKRSRCQKAHW